MGIVLLADRSDLDAARDRLARQLTSFRIRKLASELGFGSVRSYRDDAEEVIHRARALRRALDRAVHFADERRLGRARALVDRLDRDLRQQIRHLPPRPQVSFLRSLTSPSGPNDPGEQLYFGYQVRRLRTALDQLYRPSSTDLAEPVPSPAARRVAMVAARLLPARYRPRVRPMLDAKLGDIVDAGYPAHAQLYYAAAWIWRAVGGQLIWWLAPPLDDRQLANAMGLNDDAVAVYRGGYPRPT